MDNQLPSEFDLVIIGTGLIESILSAAASRIGKTVLHIDSNDYYGGQWASFNLKALNYFSPKKTIEKCETNNKFLQVGNNIFNIKDFHTKWHVPQKLETNTFNVEQELEKTDDLQKNETKETTITEEIKIEPPVLKEKDCSLGVSQESLLKESRRFNIDLIPKIHFARGDFVELLISSNIARYAEYRSVSRILTWLNDQLEVVPCSRSDVFANNKVSVIEKRMLMKLFTLLDESSDEIKNQNHTTSFKQFLKDRKLTQNIIHYVLYAISRSTDDTSYIKGIEQTKRFLNSLGRFGKTPFLFSMYGSGETAQAFCRLSAVFGGVFALSQESLSGIKLEDNKIKTVVTGDQEIKADHFVLSAEKSPKNFVKSVKVIEYISRAIFITDRSIMFSEQEHLTLLMYPPENGKNIVTVIEMGSATGTCPKNLFLVHLTSKQATNPQEDFKHIIENLFEPGTSLEQDVPERKPKIVWSCFFSMPDSSNLNLNENVPSNLYLCTGPDLDLDYDSSIKQAKGIFEKMYPELEFLPRAPDPEEIIIGGESDQNTSEEYPLTNHPTPEMPVLEATLVENKSEE